MWGQVPQASLAPQATLTPEPAGERAPRGLAISSTSNTDSLARRSEKSSNFFVSLYEIEQTTHEVVLRIIIMMMIGRGTAFVVWYEIRT